MDGCRINMSHGSQRQARELMDMARGAAAEMGRPLAIGADLQGPKLRIGEVAGGSVLVAEGSEFRLTSREVQCDGRIASVDYPHLAEDARPGDPVLLSDGAIVLRVESVAEGVVTCRVLKGGPLSSRKGVNLPGVPLRVPSLTPKDLDDMAFAVKAGADFLFLSYVRSREHLLAAREALARLGAELPLVAKIERQEGVDALAEIVDAADGICIARGDLGVEVPLGAVPAIQSEAARLCRQAGKFAMMGGQLLASMVGSAAPLRAEVADLSAVVADGLDAVVLSDETAIGAYPVEAVRAAALALARIERGRAPDRGSPCASSARDGATPAVVFSRDGRAAWSLAASRRLWPIVAVADSAWAVNWLSTCWAVHPVLRSPGQDPMAVARGAMERALGGETSCGRCLLFSEASFS